MTICFWMWYWIASGLGGGTRVVVGGGTRGRGRGPLRSLGKLPAPRHAPNIRIHAPNRFMDMRPTSAYMHLTVSSTCTQHPHTCTQPFSCVHTRHSLVYTQEIQRISCVYTRDVLCIHKRSLVYTQENLQENLLCIQEILSVVRRSFDFV